MSRALEADLNKLLPTAEKSWHHLCFDVPVHRVIHGTLGSSLSPKTYYCIKSGKKNYWFEYDYQSIETLQIPFDFIQQNPQVAEQLTATSFLYPEGPDPMEKGNPLTLEWYYVPCFLTQDQKAELALLLLQYPRLHLFEDYKPINPDVEEMA